jgi:Putative metallopeptidase
MGFAALSLVGCSSNTKTASSTDSTATTEATDPDSADDTSLNGLWSLDIDSDLFVEGNLYFIGYHELAHALVSEFELPVVGREEDGADRLATLLMTPEHGDSPDYLNAAMQGWFVEASRTPLEEISWWDEHGTNEQRGFQIACLLFGADPDEFGSIAEAVSLPEDRRETCTDEAEQNRRSWDTLLQDHLRPDDDPAPRDSVTVSYAPTKKYGPQRQLLRDIGLLDNLRDIITKDYAFDEGISIRAEECGEANAFWNPSDRKLQICYELVEDFQSMV